jgi:hypothetical protein
MKDRMNHPEDPIPAAGDLRGDPPNGDEALKGLCAHCDKRETCTLPKPEGGVWHCDEYE